MKTPEELAEEFADSGLYRLKRYVDGRVKPSQGALGLQNRACKYGFLAGYQAAKDQFADSSKVMPQWISVKDRLPEIWDDYLAFGYGPTIPACCFVAAYDPKINKWYEMSTDWDLTETIKYWMPLPKTPEDE
jgi:hypothetical protein